MLGAKVSLLTVIEMWVENGEEDKLKQKKKKSQQEGCKVKGLAQETEDEIAMKVRGPERTSGDDGLSPVLNREARHTAMQITVKERGFQDAGGLTHTGEQQEQVTEEILPCDPDQLRGHVHSEAFL